MTSNNKESNSETQKLGEAIKADAETADKVAQISSLQNRLDEVELLAEEIGQARELQDSLSDYVDDLKAEVKQIKGYRLVVTIITILMSVLLFGLLLYCMIREPSWFKHLSGELQVPLIAALGGGSVFLMSLLLRGVYRSRHERNHGDMLPEVVRIALETYKDNAGK